jgi:hypothetical protein
MALETAAANVVLEGPEFIGFSWFANHCRKIIYARKAPMAARVPISFVPITDASCSTCEHG